MNVRGSNQYKTKTSTCSRHQHQYYGICSPSWKAFFALLALAALLATVTTQARADGLPQGAYVSPIPFAIGNLDENGLPVLTPEQSADWQDFQNAARQLAPIYDFPVKVIIAQAALESGRGTSRFARERNNYFGIGAYDRDPNLAFTYSNLQQGIVEYMHLIKTRYPEAYAARSNPDRMIELIRANGYATDEAYVQKIKSLPEWRNYAN